MNLETRMWQGQEKRLHTKGNKREKERRQKKHDKMTLREIKERKGQMG
jgi:hypothetical protein